MRIVTASMHAVGLLRGMWARYLLNRQRIYIRSEGYPWTRRVCDYICHDACLMHPLGLNRRPLA